MSFSYYRFGYVKSCESWQIRLNRLQRDQISQQWWLFLFFSCFCVCSAVVTLIVLSIFARLEKDWSFTLRAFEITAFSFKSFRLTSTNKDEWDDRKDEKSCDEEIVIKIQQKVNLSWHAEFKCEMLKVETSTSTLKCCFTLWRLSLEKEFIKLNAESCKWLPKSN